MFQLSSCSIKKIIFKHIFVNRKKPATWEICTAVTLAIFSRDFEFYFLSCQIVKNSIGG